MLFEIIRGILSGFFGDFQYQLPENPKGVIHPVGHIACNFSAVFFVQI